MQMFTETSSPKGQGKVGRIDTSFLPSTDFVDFIHSKPETFKDSSSNNDITKGGVGWGGPNTHTKKPNTSKPNKQTKPKQHTTHNTQKSWPKSTQVEI